MNRELTLDEKIKILADAAKYDVACTSSGIDKRGKKGALGNACVSGICHSFSADGRCISLLKVLMTNHCIFDCKYCANRASNDIRRTAFTPEEIAGLTMDFYRRNYIEGLFLSSGIMQSPAHTMEMICRALILLRNEYRFRGYIHVKAIPGAPEELISAAGYLADRISINLELPTAQSLKKLAPHKSLDTLLLPMQKIGATIAGRRLVLGKSEKLERSRSNQYLSSSIFFPESALSEDGSARKPSLPASLALPPPALIRPGQRADFAPAGQSTQMIIGAGDESDYTILKTSQGLYSAYDLKRVFYSAYIPINRDAALPPPGTPPPLLREHRLYQADWLLRFYGFRVDELLSPDEPYFNEQLDPKCNWALRNLSLFPVEIHRAPLSMLLRVPGIGPRSACRIVEARKHANLDFDSLRKMGVVLKRARYFITCGGQMMDRIPIEQSYIGNELVWGNHRENFRISSPSHKQLSLFEDFGLAPASPPSLTDRGGRR